MSRWARILILPVVLTLGLVGISGNVYADEDTVMVNYFNIDVKVATKTRSCTEETTFHSDPAGGAGYSVTECVPGTERVNTTEETYTLEISSQYDHALVNDAFAATAGDMKVSISPNESDNYKMSITIDDRTPISGLDTKGVNLTTLRSKISSRLRTTTLDNGVGNVVSKTYTFNVGAIGQREQNVYGSVNNTGNTQATCMNSGLDTLGWILCPVMDLLSGAAQGAYDNFVEPALQVNPKLFSDNQGGGTREAWGVFRNIANTLFIILLLAVIFSQLTGVGIDNYGIKKILPKLIVSMVMINLSYWACLALVDVSNIIGNGLQALFNNLPTGNVQAAAQGFGIQGITTGLLTAAAIAAGLTTAVFAAGGGVALALTLLVSLIGVVVSIFFLFILLATREAAIVVLTVIAPVAIACYMLPNTKNWFDKWWRFFWSLLMVYPICGLLVGGGNFVSKLLLTAGGTDFFPAFVAMIAGIVPIFFIPTVLRTSLNAAGQLGAKISGMGQRVGNRFGGNTDRAIRGSESFRSRQAGFERNRKMKNAQRVQNSYKRRFGVDASGRINRGSMSSRQQQRLLEAEQALNAQTTQEAQAAVGAFPVDPELALSRARSGVKTQELRAYQDQFAGFSRQELEDEALNASTWLHQSGGSQRMSALISAMESNGMENSIYRMLESNNVGSMSGVMQTLSSSNNKVLKAYGKRGLDTDFRSFMTGTGSNSLQAYARDKGADFVSGLDDKALEEISKNETENHVQILDTDQLVRAASQINDEASMASINKMLETRSDIRGKISAEQVGNFNDTTIRTLFGNASGRAALEDATETIANDPQLASRLSAQRKESLNNAFRIPRGKSIIR